MKPRPIWKKKCKGWPDFPMDGGIDGIGVIRGFNGGGVR
jgi:hypothetical protein